MGGMPVEGKTSGEWAPKLPQSLDRRFPAAVPANLELARAGYPHLDLIAFLEFQGVDDRGRQADGKTVSPLRNLHSGAP
jgi:hypothetical protein